jgi:hypothetical protein
MDSQLRKEWLAIEIKRMRKILAQQENMLRKFESKRDTIEFEIFRLTKNNTELSMQILQMSREWAGKVGEVTNPTPPE